MLRKHKNKISTHTPLAGRDVSAYPCFKGFADFYSHAPRGARQAQRHSKNGGLLFLLTRPSRGATEQAILNKEIYAHFYSHAPRGARLMLKRLKNKEIGISTHTPLAGRDRARSVENRENKLISTHTPLAGRDG